MQFCCLLISRIIRVCSRWSLSNLMIRSCRTSIDVSIFLISLFVSAARSLCCGFPSFSSESICWDLAAWSFDLLAVLILLSFCFPWGTGKGSVMDFLFSSLVCLLPVTWLMLVALLVSAALSVGLIKITIRLYINNN